MSKGPRNTWHKETRRPSGLQVERAVELWTYSDVFVGMRGMNGFQSMDSMGGMPEMGGMGGMGGMGRSRKDPNIEYSLQCSLEDLYKGATKKMKISRTVTTTSGPSKVEETLQVDVKPGWKNMTKITFAGKGKTCLERGIMVISVLNRF